MKPGARGNDAREDKGSVMESVGRGRLPQEVRMPTEPKGAKQALQQTPRIPTTGLGHEAVVDCAEFTSELRVNAKASATKRFWSSARIYKPGTA